MSFTCVLRPGRLFFFLFYYYYITTKGKVFLLPTSWTRDTYFLMVLWRAFSSFYREIVIFGGVSIWLSHSTVPIIIRIDPLFNRTPSVFLDKNNNNSSFWVMELNPSPVLMEQLTNSYYSIWLVEWCSHSRCPRIPSTQLPVNIPSFDFLEENNNNFYPNILKFNQ